MADDGERPMLFDIRGKRKNVVRVVYAVLALLMGTSLFFVVGPVNIGELIGNSASGDPTEVFEEQAERIEQRLEKDPDNPQILISLTRTQINMGNSQIQAGPGEQREITPEAEEDYEAALETWNRYLETETGDPNASLAALVAGTFFQLAETDTSVRSAEEHVEQATEAQRIATEASPTLGSLSTLAYYEYFNGNFAAGDEAKREAEQLARSKTERQSINAQLTELRKNAKEFAKRKKQLAKVEDQLGQGESSGNPFALPGSTTE